MAARLRNHTQRRSKESQSTRSSWIIVFGLLGCGLFLAYPNIILLRPYRIPPRQPQEWKESMRASSSSISTISSSSTLSSSSSTPFQNKMNIMLFITTHFSQQHIQYFDCCWPCLMEQSKLLANIDVTIFSNMKYEFYNTNVTNRVTQLFSNNPRLQYKHAPSDVIRAISGIRSNNNKLQMGANLGMQLGFQEGWFSEYDWVIRINPDVLIRNSTWLIDAMMQDETNDGIFVKCLPSKLHTDFFAWRPNSDIFSNMNSTTMITNNTTTTTNNNKLGLPFSELIDGNHELTATKYFRPILDSGRYSLLPDAVRSRGFCRVRGKTSSVIHDHYSCRVPPNSSSATTTTEDQGYGDLVCDALEGWDIT